MGGVKMGSLIAAELPTWATAVVNAVTSMATNITDTFAAVVPVALPVGGVFLAVRRTWRAAKGLTA